MNDARFKELLNLYIDHEISPTEVGELSAEISRNPLRMRQYETYCRMQKACCIMFENSEASAPASFALNRALQQVEARLEQRRTSRRFYFNPWVVGSAASAMAACLAMVVISRNTYDEISPEEMPSGYATDAVNSGNTPSSLAQSNTVTMPKQAVAVYRVHPNFRPTLAMAGVPMEPPANEAQLANWTVANQGFDNLYDARLEAIRNAFDQEQHSNAYEAVSSSTSTMPSQFKAELTNFSLQR